MSYSKLLDHRAMVLDGHRNAAYLKAMKKVIRPDSTLLDLGAGLGVHGLNAARLGAAAVHLVEPSPVLEVARQLATAHGLDNVYCHLCRAEELRLESPVDVIVSVFTGNFLLSEDLLPSLFFARDKFLAPGGSMIPDRARMEIMPVCAPDYYRTNIDDWNAGAGPARAQDLPPLDYGILRSYAVNTLYHVAREEIAAVSLAAPVALMELDLSSATSARCDSRIDVSVEQDGVCHGWLGWFQMLLADEWFSTSGEHETTHWRPVFLPLATPLLVKAGEQLGFALQRPEYGEWTWTTTAAGSQQRQSTFLSQPLSPRRLLKSSGTYQPGRNERGEAARWLLGEMAGEASTGQLAARLEARFPVLFPGSAEALRFVQALVERYS